MVLPLRVITFYLTLFTIFPIFQVDAGPRFQPGPWKPARATFYGGPDGSETLEGACGYGDLNKEGKGYGLWTAALSKALFNEGAACGSCYEIKCDEAQSPQGCKSGAASINITATNLCQPGDWCSPPQEHFDLSQPAYLKMADYKAGVISVQYRKIPCTREGGIRFTISPKSNPYFLLILVSNVGGAGDVKEVLVRSSGLKKFTPMKRNWGQYWEISENLGGQALTFRVITSDGRSTTLWHALPKDWQNGKTYEGKKNIR